MGLFIDLTSRLIEQADAFMGSLGRMEQEMGHENDVYDEYTALFHSKVLLVLYLSMHFVYKTNTLAVAGACYGRICNQNKA